MNLSTRLSYIFGSEEYVSMRRQLVFLREKLHHYHIQRLLCSGSLGEGVAYPTSDDDLMIYFTAHRVVQTYREATQQFDLLMVPSEVSPGYCLLLDVNISFPIHFIHMKDGMQFLSSSLLNQCCLAEGNVIHGPCQSGIADGHEYDFAFSLPCSTWPNIALNWIIRNRSNDWPSCELTQNIVQNGCHVVPVGDPDSPYGQHEWRISFSVAERALMHSFNHTQFLVYNLLRLTLKRIIGKLFSEVLCSYFMKTTLFYTSENTCMEFWQEDNLETCFKTCLSVLYDYVDQIYCPSYFIPEYNMIKRKVNQTNRHQMLGIIRYVHGMGIAGVLLLSGESYCLEDNLSTNMMECKLDREFMYSHHLRIISGHVRIYFEAMHYKDIENCSLILCDFWRFLEGSSLIGNVLMKIIFNQGIICTCQNMIHRLSNLRSLNKRDYRLYKQLQYLLNLGYNVDVTTGKLTMATYMYTVGKIESALITTRQLLSEYPPYAMECCCCDRLKVTTCIDVMCGRGYSIDYKMKRAYAPAYRLFCSCLNAFPYPLRIWTMLENLEIEPITYTFFLQSLCFLQQRKQRLLKKSTRCLIIHIHDLEHIKNIIHAKMCVGIIKCVLGDNQSACRWMGSAYVMKDALMSPSVVRFPFSVMTYISCLLNRKFQSDFHQNRFQ